MPNKMEHRKIEYKNKNNNKSNNNNNAPLIWVNNADILSAHFYYSQSKYLIMNSCSCHLYLYRYADALNVNGLQLFDLFEI